MKKDFATGSDTEDVEKGPSHAIRNVVSFSWKDITVTVNDKVTKRPKHLLEGISGYVKPGEMLALMGPSGSGKTTLLNVLARRTAAEKASVEGRVLVNGSIPSNEDLRRISSYVEQEDALIGALTVRETINFSGRLSLSSRISSAERIRRVDHLIQAFGLKNQENTIVGTPLKKGLSGGQKRRLSVASQLITNPDVLFLDEPTSGLDSAASFEVVAYLKKVAKDNNLIVIASIHQPSGTTFKLFDRLVLLAQGKACYVGPLDKTTSYFDNAGFPIPIQMNPAEHIIDMVNTDFTMNKQGAVEQLQKIYDAWNVSPERSSLSTEITNLENEAYGINLPKVSGGPSFFSQTLTLLMRLFIKSYRDLLAYGVRVAMYLGLAIMMGTVWLRLDTDQESIQPFVNALFFGTAFMSFMAVAYVPAFLEDRDMYVKDRANGLYGSAVFLVSNFIIGLPYLFLISLLFSTITYWLGNFRPSATGFFVWVMWIFLDLIAAESLVVLVSSIIPNFVGALAVTAFANGLWMSVGGFMVTPKILNPFYKYVFHYIDYQAYVFQGMMVNEFKTRTYSCDSACNCMYHSDLASECKIAGQAVLDTYGYYKDKTGQWIGILLAITLVMRLLAWITLRLKK